MVNSSKNSEKGKEQPTVMKNDLPLLHKQWEKFIVAHLQGRSRKLSYRHSSIASHINSQRPWQHTQGLHNFKLKKKPALKRGVDTKFKPYPRGYLQIIPAGKGKSGFFFFFSSWVSLGIYQPHSKAGSMARKSRLKKKKPLAVLCEFVVLEFFL